MPLLKYGYARVSTVGQSVEAQTRQLAKAGCRKAFRETVRKILALGLFYIPLQRMS